MVRPQRAYGRPGTRVVPTTWATDLRPVANRTMTAPCTIRRPGTTQSWVAEQDQNVAAGLEPYFTGTCRVQALTNSRALDANVAEEQLSVAGYLVTVPATVTPSTGDLVKVTGTGDALLDGRTLRIRDIVQGSLVVERDLFCTFADRH